MLSEIKVRSPREGDLLGGRDVEQLAATMAGAGIAGLSVVTAERDFGGSLEIVRRVRSHVDIPILRKDFTAHERDLDETVEAGADAILLTVCLLEDDALVRLHGAARERGLETLVETHTDDEIERVTALGLRPDLLGINNRDIRVLETDDGDVARTERLAARTPPDQLVLSESAIAGPADAAAGPRSRRRRRSRRHLDPQGHRSGGGDPRPRVDRVGLDGPGQAVLQHARGGRRPLRRGRSRRDRRRRRVSPRPVPWSLPRRRAAALLREVPPFVSSVAVVGGDTDTILRIAEDTAPDALQLHGDEPAEVVEAVRPASRERRSGCSRLCGCGRRRRGRGDATGRGGRAVRRGRRRRDPAGREVDRRPGGGTGETVDWGDRPSRSPPRESLP